MSEFDGLKEGQSRNIRELLRKLPKVKAADDFDQRLQRRLNAEKRPLVQTGFFQRIFRTSVIGYSLVALLVVSGLSIYVIYKTGSLDYGQPHSNPVVPSSPGESGGNENASSGQNAGDVGGAAEGENNHRSKNSDANERKKGQDDNRSVHPGIEVNQSFKKEARETSPAIVNPRNEKRDLQFTQKRSVVPEVPQLTIESGQTVRTNTPAMTKGPMSPMSVPKAVFLDQRLQDSISRADSSRLDSIRHKMNMQDSSKIHKGRKPL